MNDLGLRIIAAGNKKMKNCSGFSPIALPTSLFEGSNNKWQQKLILSTNVEEQLIILKEYLNQPLDCILNNIDILAVIYLEADLKHPIKGFLSRHITKHQNLQMAFEISLSSKISCLISKNPSTYKEYLYVVSKLSGCTENFPSGCVALKVVEVELIPYLRNCLQCCVNTLRMMKSLSPTEKNEIFNLSHTSLRLLLHLIQKIETQTVSSPVFKTIRLIMKDMLFDDDVPMDTKSVCGILYINLFLVENGVGSWIKIIEPGKDNEDLIELLSRDAAKLSLYSAIPITVSIESLQDVYYDEEIALIKLLNNIIEIGERGSSESTIVLSVTRTVLQISKSLDEIVQITTGLLIVDTILSYVWTHLEHHMDSVRHLAAQALSCVVKYCSRLRKQGNEEAINKLFSTLTSLDSSRKSYFIGVTCLTTELSATTVIQALPEGKDLLINSLSVQAVQASATTALEALLQKHIKESCTEEIYKQWVQPVLSHIANRSLDSSVLNILESLLIKAAKLDENLINFILPHIQKISDKSNGITDFKSILMLLSVVRKCGVTTKMATQQSELWKGIIPYDLLRSAAVDANDETRILSFSLVVESPKSTESYNAEELQFVLWYLKYNINAQSPNFRQLTLSLLKKFIKRFEDSFKVLKRQKEPHVQGNSVDFYLTFMENLREKCFESLIKGANYSRRFLALQLLLWCEHVDLGGYKRIWNEDYVDKLLLHLEDSYETNKSLALSILEKCPDELLKNENFSISLQLNDVMNQASIIKPTECVSAAYKLKVLLKKVPDNIMQRNDCASTEPVSFTLLNRLLQKLQMELVTCEKSVVLAARNAPMYGLIHCIRSVLSDVDPRAISNDINWSSLISEIIETAQRVNKSVECVVNNSSPEGHLPMDMNGVVLSDHGNSGEVMLDDGRQVTAQMVLLCAWRSVKEVSLLLGIICSRLTIVSEEDTSGSLTPTQIVRIGEHFTDLLARTKHRGAFEQAYVGFTHLLSRLWRCRNPELHSLPGRWLQELMEAIASGDKKDLLCATRRSAGLPFMIQALVTTELQVQDNPKSFHQCMNTLLELAQRGRNDSAKVDEDSLVETRTHSINIIRALFRNSALEGSVSGYVGRGLIVALNGFEGRTWPERNSSTLLFSALMVRIFGVQRSKDWDKLCIRNRMTGRIFFLRYPQLYDFMLEKLKEASNSEDTLLRPSLYPILLLLARLYPSSLEGTVSNLKLVAFIPHVLSCARSKVLKTRQLAAKAMVPLVSPEQYVYHLEVMLTLLCDQNIKRNYCHGIILQLIRLLDAKPEIIIEQKDMDKLATLLGKTLWILQQVTGNAPCYMLCDDFMKMLNLIIWRIPSAITEEMLLQVESLLQQLLFESISISNVAPGREICLSNAAYLSFVIGHCRTQDLKHQVFKFLKHDDYEVVLSTLNYLLIVYQQAEIEACKFQEHLANLLSTYEIQQLSKDYLCVELLYNVFSYSRYLECRQKALKILSMEKDTQKLILGVDNFCEISSENVIYKFSEVLQKEPENLLHIYLNSLFKYVTQITQRGEVKSIALMDVLRIVFDYSSSENSDNMRAVVVEFLEQNCDFFINMAKLDGLDDSKTFEYKSTILATLATLIEDDNESFRQRVSKIIMRLVHTAAKNNVVSTKASELLRDFVEQKYEGEERIAMFVLLALLDFKSEVCVMDVVSEECRVFDQNEKHNIFLEETVCSAACAAKILHCYDKKGSVCILDFIKSLIENSVFRETFNKLCGLHVHFYKKKVKRGDTIVNEFVNPKIDVFINKLI